MTARRHLTNAPSAVWTAVARSPLTLIEVTVRPHSTRAPADSARRTRAAANWPAPPTGTGKPPSCPIMISSVTTPLPGASIGTSACIALPSNSRRAASPLKRCSAMTPAGMSSSCVRRSASAVPLTQQAQRTPHRRERREQRFQQGLLDPVPLVEEITPAPAITRASSIQLACGPIDVPIDHGRVLVGAVACVPHHRRSVHPLQTVESSSWRSRNAGDATDSG